MPSLFSTSSNLILSFALPSSYTSKESLSLSMSKMLLLPLISLLGAFTLATARAVASPALDAVRSEPTCACTTTVTQIKDLIHQARQVCPPIATVTSTSFVTIIQNPISVTVANADPSLIASEFSSFSQLEWGQVIDSVIDRPTGDFPDTGLRSFTGVASALAVVGSEAPNDGTSAVYIWQTIGLNVPVATTTFVFTPPPGFSPPPRSSSPPQRAPLSSPWSGWNGTYTNGTMVSAGSGTGTTQSRPAKSTVTDTTYVATQTVTVNTTTRSTTLAPVTGHPSSAYYGPAIGSSSITSPSNPQKRQVCTLIFALINGEWTSWCNNWDGSKVLSYSTYDTTVIEATVPGASPPPDSVVHPSSTSTGVSASLTSSISATSIPTSTSVEVTATVVTTVVTASDTKTLTSSSSGEVTSAPTSAIPNSLSSTSSAPPSQSSCGQVGTFVITFDDLPTFSTSHPDNETTSPPIFNPYEHFYWSGGYGYGPPPNEPYVAHDGQRLAEYNPSSEPQDIGNPNAGALYPGSFGAGPRAYNDNYWFDAHSVWIGCNNTGTNLPCDFVATGYHWTPADPANPHGFDGHETLAFTQHFHPEPCSTLQGCQLSQIFLNPAQFSGLSSLNFYAQVEGAFLGFFIDTLELAWWNNTCAAGLARISSRK